jgi:hypothetical protein
MKGRQDCLETLDQHFDRFRIERFLFQEFENRHRACPLRWAFSFHVAGERRTGPSLRSNCNVAALHNFPDRVSARLEPELLRSVCRMGAPEGMSP